MFLQPLSRSIDYHFSVNFSLDFSSEPGYVGSDMWALRNYHVSVTPLRNTLLSVPLTQPVLQSLYPMFEEKDEERRNKL